MQTAQNIFYGKSTPGCEKVSQTCFKCLSLFLLPFESAWMAAILPNPLKMVGEQPATDHVRLRQLKILYYMTTLLIPIN